MSTGSVLWATVVLCAQLHTEIKCQVCVLAFYQKQSLQLFPRLRENGLNFTDVSLKNLLTAWFGQCSSRWVGSGLVLICFILGGSEGREKYSWWFLCWCFLNRFKTEFVTCESRIRTRLSNHASRDIRANFKGNSSRCCWGFIKVSPNV